MNHLHEVYPRPGPVPEPRYIPLAPLTIGTLLDCNKLAGRPVLDRLVSRITMRIVAWELEAIGRQRIILICSNIEAFFWRTERRRLTHAHVSIGLQGPSREKPETDKYERFGTRTTAPRGKKRHVEYCLRGIQRQLKPVGGSSCYCWGGKIGCRKRNYSALTEYHSELLTCKEVYSC